MNDSDDSKGASSVTPPLQEQLSEERILADAARLVRIAFNAAHMELNIHFLSQEAKWCATVTARTSGSTLLWTNSASSAFRRRACEGVLNAARRVAREMMLDMGKRAALLEKELAPTTDSGSVNEEGGE